MDFSQFEQAFITPLVRHLASAAAGALVTGGVIAATQAGATTDVMTTVAGGGILFLANQAWSWFKNRNQVKTVAPAKAATPAAAPARPAPPPATTLGPVKA